MNQASGVIDLWANSGLYGTSYGNEYLINQGAINMMSGTSSTINFISLTNQAVLSVQHGTLQVQRHPFEPPVLWNPGCRDVQPGRLRQIQPGQRCASDRRASSDFERRLHPRRDEFLCGSILSFSVREFFKFHPSQSSARSRLGPRLWRHDLDIGAPTAHCDSILREPTLSSASMAHRGIRPSCLPPPI